ncbi:MAG: glycosyltransferase, partial [Chloroflexota bacterium]|nr:glycosyltransferase [Chloroflexota bacterium]
MIIVSYNTCALLRSCLRSVFASAAISPELATVDVLVVDNASHDDSATMVKREFPTVQLVASPENRGYTGGNNLGLALLGFNVAGSLSQLPALSQPDYVLLLNADTEVVGDALAQMVQCLQ